MEFTGIKKLLEGRFITRYNVSYRTADGGEKVYEMISRDKNLQSFEDLNNPKTDAVVIIMTSPDGNRILLNREFRLAAGRWVYNFPAGLIDEGENVREAAARELREETGLTLLRIDDILENSYSAIGFSNEKNTCVFGAADGTFSKSTSPEEEIEAGWYTKEEVRKLLREGFFAARTQAYLYLWSKE